MFARWIIPILVLPGTVLFFVPALILWLSKGTPFAASPTPLTSPFFWLAILFAIPGTTLAITSGALFFHFGEGTAAPWDPPRNLVIRGPYRYVRNPMITGVIMLLIAESLFFGSWPLAIWATIFAIGNAIYFPRFEEPALIRRHGDPYQIYSQNVPRWIPRIRPWRPET